MPDFPRPFSKETEERVREIVREESAAIREEVKKGNRLATAALLISLIGLFLSVLSLLT